MKICPNCGAELNDSASFCTYCGSSVANTDSFTQGAFSGQAQYQQAPSMQARNQSEVQFSSQVQPQMQDIKGFDPSSYNAAPVVNAAPGNVQYYSFHDNPEANYQRDAGLATAIKVFMIIGCVLSVQFFCIPLFWRLPMTIHAFKKLNNNEAMGTGFKVCTLLFTNLIAGIMMFIIKDEDMPFDR